MIAIVDYGMGNIGSVMNALAFLGAESELTAEPGRILGADKVILPGVGAFGAAMQKLEAIGLVPVLREAAMERGIPFLGICLGMQLLAESGDEHGSCSGLGLIPGRVRHINDRVSGVRVPHIGFNSLVHRRDSILLHGLEQGRDFYFVHSYQFEALDEYVAAVVEYEGVELTAVVELGSVFGVQFHPEKSQSNGLDLLSNFIALPAC